MFSSSSSILLQDSGFFLGELGVDKIWIGPGRITDWIRDRITDRMTDRIADHGSDPVK